MTFAAITPALIVGAMAERMKFSAIALFIPLWVTFVYFPIAHMVWYWAGPEAIVAAAKAVAEAGADAAKKAAAEAALAAVQANAGMAFQWGALDFAGGTVVHINSGIAGPRRRPDGRQARRLRQGGHAAPFADTDAGRRRAAVGGLVRLQRRLGARSRRHRRAGDDQHLRRHRRRSAGLAARREHRPRASPACSAPSPVPSPAWLR